MSDQDSLATDPLIELPLEEPVQSGQNEELSEAFYRIDQKHPGEGKFRHWLSQVRKFSGRLAERVTAQMRLALSPSLREVRAYNRGLDPDSKIGRLMPPDRFDDVTKFIVNYEHNSMSLNVKNLARKFAGKLGLASERPTVTELVANMVDLEDEDSKLREVLRDYGPQIEAQEAKTETGKEFADLDVAAKLGGETLYRAMQLSDEEIAQQIEILHDIGDELRDRLQEIQAAHEAEIASCIEGMSVEERADPKTILRLQKINKKTAKKINKMMGSLFDHFRKVNKAEIGYNQFTKLLAHSPSFHYYFWQLIYTTAINLPVKQAYQVFGAIPGAGPLIDFATNFVGGLPANFFGQSLAVGASASNSAQRSLDPNPSVASAPANDIESYHAMKMFIEGLNALVKEAVKQYADPANDIGVKAKERIENLVKRGYENEPLKEVAPLLSALAEYQRNLMPEKMGMTAYGSKPAMVAEIIQTFAEDLPDISHLSAGATFTLQQKEEYVKAILEKIHQKYPDAARTNDPALVPQILGHAAKISESGEDVAPDKATLLAHDPRLTEITEKIFEATKDFVKSSFSNKMFHEAQLQGLVMNAVVGTLLQTVLVGGLLGIGVLTHGGALPIILAIFTPFMNFCAGYLGASAGSFVWSTKNQKNISKFLMFQYLKERNTNPLLSEAEKRAIDESLAKEIRSLVAEIHPQLMEQIKKVTAAKTEDQAVKTRQRYYDDGASMAQVVNECHGTDPSLIARLTAGQVALDRKLASTKNYRITLETLEKRKEIIDDLGNKISNNFDLDDHHAGNVAQVAAQSKENMDNSFGVKLASKHRKRYAEYYPNEDGVLPKQAEVDQLRKEFRDVFDKYWETNKENPDFRISQKEWTNITAFLRMSHKDEETEAWIKTREEIFGTKLERNSTASYHLEMARGKLPEDRLILLQDSWDEGSLEIKERMATMIRLISDLLNLIQGKYDNIEDPEGYLKRMLSSPELAILELKKTMSTDPLTSAVSRFVGREVQQMPLGPLGIVGVPALAALSGIGAAAPLSGNFAASVEPTVNGEPLDVYGLADPILAHAGLLHPETFFDPFTFGSRNTQGQYSGFAADDAILDGVKDQITAEIKEKFGDKITSFWSGKEISVDDFLKEFMATMGASKLASRAEQIVKQPVDFVQMDPDSKEAWRQTRSITKQRSKRFRRNMRNFFPQIQAGVSSMFNYWRNILPNQQGLINLPQAAGEILALQEQEPLSKSYLPAEKSNAQSDLQYKDDRQYNGPNEQVRAPDEHRYWSDQANSENAGKNLARRARLPANAAHREQAKPRVLH